MTETILQSLKRVKVELSGLLPQGVKIHDIVYRPYDMGVFGGKGFSVGLITKDGKLGYGKLFDNPPTNTEIKKLVADAKERINGRIVMVKM